MNKIFSQIAFLVTLLAAPLAQADFIANTYDLNPTLPSASTGPNFSTTFEASTTYAAKIGYDSGASSSTAAGQRFTVPGTDIWSLSQLTLPVALSSGFPPVPGIFNFEIRSDSSDTPMGALLYSGNFSTLSAGTISETLSSVSVPILSETLVTGGSSYWVVLKQGAWLPDFSPGGFSGMYWGSAQGESVSGDFTRAIDTLTSSGGMPPNDSSWVVSGPGGNRVPYAMAMEGVNLSSVPEPGQVAMAGLLFAGIAGYTIRRRQANEKKA